MANSVPNFCEPGTASEAREATLITIELSPRTLSIEVVTRIAASLIAGGRAEIEVPDAWS